MIESIKELFAGEVSLSLTKDGHEPKRDLLIAIGIMMLEMAGADNDFAPEEVQACFRSLEKHFDITDQEALSILEEAETARADREKVSELIAYVNNEFDEKQRCLVLALIWKVVVADEKIEHPELRYSNQLRVRLQLSEEQGEEARKLAFEGGI